ncbi:hypothetical protein SVAN01_01655 [Stagonosporopsis vannaccii]|nr:hypothetical protein SVAN01_01655 [Stagonosporopsis vannaccii]
MRYHEVGSMVLDVVLCLLPIAFVVIATLALSMHNAPKSPSGERVQSYTLLAPTVFPIIYAAIVGRTLRRIGLYMAEKGSTIGKLERIVGCQSLFSAIERQYTLGHFDGLGIVILLVWLLSPVGGQSSLRLLAYEPQTVYSVIPAYYYPPQAYTWASLLLNSTDAKRFHHVSVPYMAALQSSSQTVNSSRDMWGNLKIPDIRSLDGYDSNKSVGTWHRISNDSQITYASLLGSPIFGMPSSGNATFNLTSHYWSIDCKEVSTGPSQTDPLPPGFNSSTYALFTLNQTSAAGLRTIYASRKPFAPGNALTGNVSLTYIVRATCIAQPVRLETQIACWGTTCRAQAVRELDWVSFDDQRLMLYSNYTDLLNYMMTADQSNAHGGATQSQMTETFISDQIRFAGYGSVGSWVDISSIPLPLLSRRLQQAINTYSDASVGNLFHSWEHSPDELPPSICTVRGSWACDERGLNWNVTALQLSKHSGVKYVCKSGYAVVTIAISCFLLLAAVLCLVLGIVTTAPDILGFVSTAARYNIYFEDRVPSHLDGLEAARRLKDTKVMIGDVTGNDEVGNIAFTSLDAAPRRLIRDRLYA